MPLGSMFGLERDRNENYIVLLVIMALVFHFFPLRFHTVAF